MKTELMVVTMGDDWAADILQRNLKNAGVSLDEIHLDVFTNGPVDGRLNNPWAPLRLAMGADMFAHPKGENIGFPAAANNLLHNAMSRDADEFIVIDDDVAFPPGWIAELRKARRAVIKDGRPVGLGGIPLDAWRNDELGILTDIGGVMIRPRATPIGGCRHLDRKIIDELGYICEGYFPCGGDDVDYCTRLAWAGKFNYHIDALRSTHEHHERIDPEYQARKRAMLARIPEVDAMQQFNYRQGRFKYVPERLKAAQ